MSKTSEQEGVTGTLTQGIEQAYEGMKQGPSSATLFWVGGALAVGLIIFLFWWFWSSSEAVSSERWRELGDVVFPAQLEAYLEKGEVRDTTQGRLAQFKKARMELASGLRGLASDSRAEAAAAREQVAEAIKTYTALTKATGLVPALQMEALLGAAKGNEALGDYDEAKTYYQKLAENYKDTDIGKEAQEKVSQFDSNKDDLDRLKEAFGARK